MSHPPKHAKAKKPKKHPRREIPRVVRPLPEHLQAYSYHAKVDGSQVYDGDTIKNVTIEIFHKMSLGGLDIRIARIQAPEIRTRDKEEKAKGYAARDALKELICEKNLEIQFIGTGNFGRWICLFWLPDGKNLSDLMMESGYAELYKG